MIMATVNNTKDNIDKIIERVQKLKTLSTDSGATDGEAANAAAFASKLMEQYSIDNEQLILFELNNSSDDSLVATNFSNKLFLNSKDCPGYYNSLSIAIARLFDCETRFDYKEKEGKRYTFISIYGYKDVGSSS